MAGPASAQRNLMKTVSASGFADASASTAPAEASAKHARTPDITPVEILYKPKPVYTAEARQLHIEGEVLLDIMFGASGDVRVLRVLRGLGHGLDEAAEIAGQKIRFEPAKRDGRPYDSDAVVHIVFELAD
jgi:TonB family protein